MGLLGKIISTVRPGTGNTEEIAKRLPLADCAVDDCANCDVKDYPSTVKVEEDIPLWGFTNPWVLHILISTGHTDWKHDIADEHDIGGKIASQLRNHKDDLFSAAKGNVMMQSSSFLFDGSTGVTADSKTTSLLLLPYFVVIHKVTAENSYELVARVIRAYMAGTIPELLASEPEVFEASPNRAFLLLCSHRTRDKRCGITAPIMRKNLEIELRHHALYRDVGDATPGGVTVGYVSHVGGHKFAANLFMYSKTGENLWMARVRPHHARAVVEYSVLQGKVFPELLRQCFKSDKIAW